MDSSVAQFDKLQDFQECKVHPPPLKNNFNKHNIKENKNRKNILSNTFIRDVLIWSTTWHQNSVFIKADIVRDFWVVPLLMGVVEVLIEASLVSIYSEFHGEYIRLWGAHFYITVVSGSYLDVITIFISWLLLILSAFVCKHRMLWCYILLSILFHILLVALSFIKYVYLILLADPDRAVTEYALGFDPVMSKCYLLLVASSIIIPVIYYACYLCVYILFETQHGRDSLLRSVLYVSPALAAV